MIELEITSLVCECIYSFKLLQNNMDCVHVHFQKIVCCTARHMTSIYPIELIASCRINGIFIPITCSHRMTQLFIHFSCEIKKVCFLSFSSPSAWKSDIIWRKLEDIFSSFFLLCFRLNTENLKEKTSSSSHKTDFINNGIHVR